MSITIRNTPADFTPVNNPIEWTATSSNDTEPAFKYIVQIYIGGVEKWQQKFKPEPLTGNDLLIVQVDKILRDYITKNLYGESSVKGILAGNQSFTSYQIRIGEEYEVAGTLTQFPNLTNATAYAFNGALSYTDFVDFLPATYLDTKFLTEAPAIRNTDLMGLGALHLMLDAGTTLTNWTIKTYLATVLQNTYLVTTALSATNYYTFAAGFDAINNIDSANITGAPVQPILTSAIDQYTVEATLSTGQSEVITYNLVAGCLSNDPVRVHWLNRLGGYDFFDFALTSRDSYKVEKKTMKQPINAVTGVGVVIYSKQDRVNVDYCVTETRTRQLTSNWISEVESEWLKDLISSQDIYIEEGGELIAVTITDNSYDVKQEKLDELFQLDFRFKYAVDSGRQQF